MRIEVVSSDRESKKEEISRPVFGIFVPERRHDLSSECFFGYFDTLVLFFEYPGSGTKIQKSVTVISSFFNSLSNATTPNPIEYKWWDYSYIYGDTFFFSKVRLGETFIVF